jgi:hypothetical protein
MTTTARRTPRVFKVGVWASLQAAALCLGAGCSSSATSGGEGGASNSSELFAVPTQIFGADFLTATSYVPLVPSLDVSRIELDGAREIDARATMAHVGKWLFLASSTSPVIERFEVTDAGKLKPAGRLSFAERGLPDYFSIDEWGAAVVSPEKAYVFNTSDGSHVVWNPTTLEIVGEIPGPDILVEGYTLESVAIVRGNYMYRVFTLLNYESWDFLAEPQYLAVYDVRTDELISISQDGRCPQLYSRPFADEAGDIYFSNYIWTPVISAMGTYPKSCALRVKSGEAEFDPDYKLDFAEELTDGREAGILRYLGDGQALLDVFHDERVTFEEDSDPEEIANTPNWRIWSVDLKTKTGSPLAEFDFKTAGYQDASVDDRTFLMVPNDDYSETTSYEVVSGEPKQRFKIQGSSYQMARLK